VVRGAQEPYRYEREVEEFLRWSPHVRNAREKLPNALSRDQLVELQRLLGSFADTAGIEGGNGEADRVAAAERRAAEAERAAEEAMERAGRAERAAAEADRRSREAVEPTVRRVETGRPQRHGSPVEHYDDLAAEEVIALLASLERDDLQTLRDYERRHANRVRVLSAIDSVLARGETRV
jgi:hypothetical protein